MWPNPSPLTSYPHILVPLLPIHPHMFAPLLPIVHPCYCPIRRKSGTTLHIPGIAAAAAGFSRSTVTAMKYCRHSWLAADTVGVLVGSIHQKLRDGACFHFSRSPSRFHSTATRSGEKVTAKPISPCDVSKSSQQYVIVVLYQSVFWNQIFMRNHITIWWSCIVYASI
jgi:hypothetical protein